MRLIYYFTIENETKLVCHIIQMVTLLIEITSISHYKISDSVYLFVWNYFSMMLFVIAR